ARLGENAHHRNRLGHAAASLGAGVANGTADQGSRGAPGLPGPEPGVRRHAQRCGRAARLLPARARCHGPRVGYGSSADALPVLELLGDLSMSLPRLRAPQGDGEILAHPPLAAAAELTARNRAAFAESQIEIDGI